MTVVACIEAAAIVAVVWLLLRHQRQNDVAWTFERRELLTRIQRPELIPTAVSPEWTAPEDDEPDDMRLVGTIAEPEEYEE